MSVERYEQFWMWGAGVLIVSFLGAIGASAEAVGAAPSSDPASSDPQPLSSTTTTPKRAAKAVLPFMGRTVE